VQYSRTGVRALRSYLDKMKNMIKITLVKSLIGVPDKQRRVVRALGLGKRGSTVVKEQNKVVDGMIFKVNHLIETERVEK
jgi:large subunit ribosomal protein L30